MARKADDFGPLSVKPRMRDGAVTSWYIDIPPHLSPTGKRARPQFPDKSTASTEARMMMRSLSLDGAIRKHRVELSGFTFAEVSERWFAHQMERVDTVKKRQISLETNAYRLAALLKLLGHMDIASIGEDQVTMVQRERLKDGKAPATINSETRLLKQIVKWALDKGLVVRELNVEKIPEPRRRIALPTQKEVEAILAHLPEGTAMLVHLLAETGFRSGEAFHLEWSDLDFKQNTISVQPKGPWTPKTQHSHRTVAVTPTLMQALEAARSTYLATLASGEQASPLVFRGRGGGRVWDFRRALKTAIVAAGVTRAGQPMHITPHMFRKAHATWLAERGVNEALLQPRLGHAPGSRVTQESYVHVQSPEALKATVVSIANYRRTA